MLVEYYFKLCQEHPLIDYIEDPFAEGDLLGYQKLLRRFAQSKVRIGVKNWFKS